MNTPLEFPFAKPLTSRYQEEFEYASHQWTEHGEAAHAMFDVAWQHFERLARGMRQQGRTLQRRMEQESLHAHGRNMGNPANLGKDWLAYVTDAAQRTVLTLDTLRQRGNTFIEHEAAGMPPVLDFNYEVVIDGRELQRPVNYSLLRIIPEAHVQFNEDARPFIIVDPRAGHGAGIGGFKAESQVGEALEQGHPVYFVAFHPVPEPGQTLADVRDAEVEFVREVVRRHPQSPKPTLIGNCQGGWATMLVAASAPELIGPVVINGAPMSYWAGKVGQNPMRYLGGLRGGAMPALLLSDLGAGVFDGSSLVSNFEDLNPANTYFRKLYNLYANVDSEAARFLEFERWWGGFFLMNEEEIRWIVENLFVGNKLARGEAALGGERIDLRVIASPIIVFASHGDNITPPQQALNWIADLYTSVEEIKARGQRIIYMLHESIGHLGIFVSGKIAGREHDAITHTMQAVEALAPGLYEMRLEEADDRVHIRFEPRTLDDILALDDGRDDEKLFASVARLSQLGTEMYDMMLRPWVQRMVTPRMAKMFRDAQPLRMRRSAFSDLNPLMPVVGSMADQVRARRSRPDASNPFTTMERTTADWIEASLNLYRDVRDAWQETLFHGIYGMPAMRVIGESVLAEREHRRSQDVRNLPYVQAALQQITEGSAADGVIRMICLMGHASGRVRHSILEREMQALGQQGTFTGLDEKAVAKLVHTQSIIVTFEPEQALATLPLLLDSDLERARALELLHTIIPDPEVLQPASQVLLQRFVQLLDTPVDNESRAALPVPAQPDPLTMLPEPAAVAAPRAPELHAIDGHEDDLEVLRGVGPRMAEKMRALGIRTFAQLGAFSPAEVAWLDLKLEARGRIVREKWIEQAQALAAAAGQQGTRPEGEPVA